MVPVHPTLDATPFNKHNHPPLLTKRNPRERNPILDDQSKRVVLRIPPALAPIKAAILPLVKKDGLPEIAEEIVNQLKYDYNLQIDQKIDYISDRYQE